MTTATLIFAVDSTGVVEHIITGMPLVTKFINGPLLEDFLATQTEKPTPRQIKEQEAEDADARFIRETSEWNGRHYPRQVGHSGPPIAIPPGHIYESVFCLECGKHIDVCQCVEPGQEIADLQLSEHEFEHVIVVQNVSGVTYSIHAKLAGGRQTVATVYDADTAVAVAEAVEKVVGLLTKQHVKTLREFRKNLNELEEAHWSWSGRNHC